MFQRALPKHPASPAPPHRAPVKESPQWIVWKTQQKQAQQIKITQAFDWKRFKSEI
jgi:hypothetical protein